MSQHSSCMEAEGSAPMKLRVSFHVGLRSFETTVVCFSAPPTYAHPHAVNAPAGKARLKGQQIRSVQRHPKRRKWGGP